MKNLPIDFLNDMHQMPCIPKRSSSLCICISMLNVFKKLICTFIHVLHFSCEEIMAMKETKCIYVFLFLRGEGSEE